MIYFCMYVCRSLSAIVGIGMFMIKVKCAKSSSVNIPLLLVRYVDLCGSSPWKGTGFGFSIFRVPFCRFKAHVFWIVSPNQCFEKTFALKQEARFAQFRDVSPNRKQHETSWNNHVVSMLIPYSIYKVGPQQLQVGYPLWLVVHPS